MLRPSGSADPNAEAVVGHTPGPWVASKPGELKPEYERIIVADQGKTQSGIRRIRTVAFMCGNAGEQETLANARLIAAAPASAPLDGEKR